MSTATAAAALQQAPITFQSRSPRISSAKPVSLTFSGGLRLPKLTVKLVRKSRRGGGAAGSRMAESAAGSYAAALAEIASENGTLEETIKDVEKVEQLFSDDSVYDFFVSPIVSLEDKREQIDMITASGSLQTHVCNFLNVLIESRRIDMIKEIIKEFEVICNRMTETEMVVVTSVVKLESQHLAQIAKQVQKLTGAKNVRVKTKIDESLVAGFTIRYGSSGSKLIDMSVKTQLEEITAQLEIEEIPITV